MLPSSPSSCNKTCSFLPRAGPRRFTPTADVKRFLVLFTPRGVAAQCDSTVKGAFTRLLDQIDEGRKVSKYFNTIQLF